eukprot:950900-Pleurochrysis_carterae.AAC.7
MNFCYSGLPPENCASFPVQSHPGCNSVLPFCFRQVKIAVVGKYTDLSDAYLSVTKALSHASFAVERKLVIKWIDSTKLDVEYKAIDHAGHDEAWETLRSVDGIMVQWPTTLALPRPHAVRSLALNEQPVALQGCDSCSDEFECSWVFRLVSGCLAQLLTRWHLSLGLCVQRFTPILPLTLPAEACSPVLERLASRSPSFRC